MKAEPISRRQMLFRLAGALVGMSLAAACAPIGSPAPPGLATAAVTTAPALAKKGGTLVVAQIQPMLSTDPFPSNVAVTTFKWAVFNPLVSLDSKLQPIPLLAESWRFSDDQRTLTLKLRPGVTFHSGRTFTADDAKWNLEHAQDPKSQAAAGGELKGVQARAVDSGTLELKLPDLFPHIFSLLTGVLMVDPQSDIALNAAGTGAFRLDSFRPGDEVQLVRNEQYWHPDRPYVDKVTIKTLPDPTGAVLSLESGDCSIVQCRASDVQHLKSGNQTTAVVLPGSGSYEFLISAMDPPFTDKRVRQAINLAVDRKRFAETLMYGLTSPTYIMWIRRSPVWDASLDVGEFNLDKARQLLADAGYPNGFETKIQTNNGYPELVQFDQIVQADLAKIGISASIEPLDATQAGSLVTQGKFSALINHQYAYGDQDPAMQFTAFVFRPDGNASRFQSDEYRQLVDTARREPDWDKRLALYRHIATLVRDEAFVLPIANYVSAYGLRSNVQGFSRQPLQASPVLEDIWLA